MTSHRNVERVSDMAIADLCLLCPLLCDVCEVILNRIDPEHKVDEFEFGANEVYAIDIIMSSGDGKPKQIDTRQTSIYKRNHATTYNLKNKISRAVLSDIDNKCKYFPFSLRHLEDPVKAKFGMLEASQHDLVHAYPVLYERDGEFVAQVKFTVVVQSAGATRLTGPVQGLDVSHATWQSEYKITNQEIIDTLKISASAAAAKKKKKAKKKTTDGKEDVTMADAE